MSKIEIFGTLKMRSISEQNMNALKPVLDEDEPLYVKGKGFKMGDGVHTADILPYMSVGDNSASAPKILVYPPSMTFDGGSYPLVDFNYDEIYFISNNGGGLSIQGSNIVRNKRVRVYFKNITDSVNVAAANFVNLNDIHIGYCYLNMKLPTNGATYSKKSNIPGDFNDIIFIFTPNGVTELPELYIDFIIINDTLYINCFGDEGISINWC